MQDILRGQFSSPLNREHFHQLCRSLVEAQWGVPFDFNPRSIERSEKVRLSTYLKDTDCFIAINCQWHGRNAPSPTFGQIDDAVAAAHVFHERIDLFFVLVPGVVSDQLNEHIAQLNLEHRRNGQFSIQVWCWDAIEERLNNYKQAAKKYLSEGLAMNPHWFAGAFEYVDRKVAWTIRLPSGKKDRNKPALGGKSNAAFNRSVADAFEQYVHATQYQAKSRYLRVENAVNMGHAVALIHDNYQVELWLLTPEPRDTEFRAADTKRWVQCLMEHTVKHAFAHVLLKNYRQRETIGLSIRFVQLKPPTTGGAIAFATYPKRVEKMWGDLYPNEPLEVKRYLLAEARIDGDQVTVTQHVFAFGWTLAHVYQFPLSSVSYSIVRHALVNRFYPKAVPHSHRVLLEGQQTHWRPFEQYDKHACRQIEHPQSPVARLTCRSCSGSFFGYRNESRCSVCYLEHGIFGSAAGVATSYSELFQNEIARLPLDF
jgi:hypothetical protein